MSKTLKKVLYMHTGSGNHGCEAIIRTTAKLFDAPANTILWSQSREEDEKYGAANCFEKVVVSEEIPKYSRSYFEALFQRKILKNNKANFEIFIRDLFKGNVAVSVGGDNYCYPWSVKYGVEWNKEIRKHASKTVFWGCSVEEQFLSPEVKEDLSKFDLITAREPITYSLLRKYNSNTIKVADPAFLLEREDLPLPEGFIEGNTIGINISPLISKYASEEVIVKNYEELIRFIIKETSMNVCLIPHVVWSQNDDSLLNERLYKTFKDTERIVKVDDCNCQQLKGYIARCRLFIGARTHATIAAYSSRIPTLVVGYSVKSRGIAEDLFGTDEGYVIPVQSLKENQDLQSAFTHILINESSIKDRLEKRMPDYIEEAKAAKAIAFIND